MMNILCWLILMVEVKKMSETIITVGATILILANLFLFAIITYFARGKKDKASKTGFGFMKIITLLNAIFITGGVFVLC